MPTYDYVCKNCDHRWELFQSMTANPVRKCPNCKKLQAKRVIGAGAGILFKGSGFYQTDYRSDAYRKAAEADRKAQEGQSGQNGSSGSNSSDGSQASSTSSGQSGSSSQANE